MLRAFLFAVLALSLPACEPAQESSALDPEIAKWEQAIQRLEHQDSLSPDPDDAILFVGSSSIAQWGSLHADMQPYRAIQRGYGGAKFSDVSHYLKRLVYPHQFAALVFFVANDIAGIGDDKEPEEVRDLFANVVDQVREKYATEPVFFVQITPTRSRWGVWDQIDQANRLIRSYCQQTNNVTFIDTASAYLGADGKPRPELFREDQLHLNYQGYQVWASLIKSALDGALKQ